ncbi:CDK4/6, putative [Acrodontium crateriforme]|uniref:non-specific serine/threonine protein kinase n=1 Tax=Acrodontium crateriforme TaxID=150365 RepID=A0AAQ3MCN9_9PEZI|nr:CDK4/6, putative [Acrodontium crateriforme]
MHTPGRFLKSLLRGRRASPPRDFPLNGFKLVDGKERLEEENWEWYSPEVFYPVRLGEIFCTRYQVLGKLGYGAHSTAWLCRDLEAHRYVTLKVCEQNSPSTAREAAAYEHLRSLRTSHSGALLIRQLLDAFKIKGVSGDHMCFVHEPLGMSLETFRQLMPGNRLPKDLVKAVSKHLLLALDCLHTEAGMIHTDLQARNVHLRIEDETMLKEFESRERSDPSLRKVDGQRIIYESRGFMLPSKMGRPILCDFGEARYGPPPFVDDIQPYIYRAPEVILDIPWGVQTDVWNLGVLIWDLLEGRPLFTARGEDGEQLIKFHLAEMIALMGPPPINVLQRTQTSLSYFDSRGSWKASAAIPQISLEASENVLSPGDKIAFLKFLRRMLTWAPEDRASARQLLDDSWLK